MPAGEHRNGRGNGRKKPNEHKAFRAITATGGSVGLIAIVIFLANIQSGIQENCDATRDVGHAVIGVVSVDNELSESQNRNLRDALIRNLRGNVCG